MNKLVITSTQPGVGKTCLIIGLMQFMGSGFGYMKPLGNKLRYYKKRLWDYDAALITKIFGLKEEPEEMSLGFEHAKLRFAYNEKTIPKKLQDDLALLGQGKKLMFIEGGGDLKYGGSVHLDALSLARYLEARLIIVVSGQEDAILDDIRFIRNYISAQHSNLAGIVINEVSDIKEFKELYLKEIEATGIKILGIIPDEPALRYVSANFLVEYLMARVLAGAEHLDGVIKNVVVGASSAGAALHDRLFNKEKKLVITSGDRSDMILAALESDTACVMVTNNITPEANIISKVADSHIPLLLVPWDTYDTAVRINRMEPFLTKDDTTRIKLLADLIKTHVSVKEIINI